MTAIATTYQRVHNAVQFFSEYASTNYLYVWIAKSDYWSDDIAAVADGNSDTPVGFESDYARIHDNMIGMKKVATTDMIYMAPRYDWSTGATFVAWDDADPDIFDKAFYCMTDEYKVYKCVKAGSGTVLNKPTHTNEVVPTAPADGYRWAYMFTIPTLEVNKFLNSSFIPVKMDFDAAHTAHRTACRTNAAGKIYNVVVTSGGSGYTSTPTASILGRGSGSPWAAVASPAVSLTNQVVTGVTIAYGNEGLYYDTAKVTFTGGGGTGAAARAILPPGIAHGVDPLIELGASYACVAVDLSGNESNLLMVGNDFRQLGLIKNPVQYGGSPAVYLTSSVASGLKSLTFSSCPFLKDDVIKQTSPATEARGFVDYVNGNTLYYHQNYKTGWTAFASGATVTNGNGAGGQSAVITGKGNEGYERYLGEIIFIENRSKIDRDSATTEKVRIVIQF